MDESVLDDIIRRLVEFKNGRMHRLVHLPEIEIRQLCFAAREIFLTQPCLLELEAPVNICGDTHAQYPDLLQIFDCGGFPPAANYLFLGNYVDYGNRGIETICLLLAYKIKCPENLFLLRGNHECASINRIYGFYDECKRRYNVQLWKVFTDCFNCLPVAAIVEDKMFCVHGGLSPDLKDMNQIKNIPRPTDVPNAGLLCDLLWADPCLNLKGWGENYNDDNDMSYTFGADKVCEFLLQHDLDIVCRGHQVVEDGFEFFAGMQLVTIFSAPNYRGEYDNAGAMMNVDETLACKFQILKPSYVKLQNRLHMLQASPLPNGNVLESEIAPDQNVPRSRAAPDENVPRSGAASCSHNVPSSSGKFTNAETTMSIDDDDDDAVLCLFQMQILNPFEKKRKVRFGNISQNPRPPLRKEQKQ